MAKLLGGTTIYGNATVNSYLTVSGNADLSGGNVAIGTGNTLVASIVISNIGNTYTTNPTVTVSAPTTLYGATATANANIGVYSIGTFYGGSGYAVGNVLTMANTTSNAISNATFTVTSVLGNTITGLAITTPGVYFSSNTNPITFTGGSGTGATANVYYGVNRPTITYAGVGYTETPAVTITGGGGTGATAYALVGAGNANVQTLSNAISFQTPAGEQLRVSTGNVFVTNGVIAAPAHVATNGLIVTNANINSNYTSPAGMNMLSVGPVTIASNVNVTVATGQRWLIL